VIVGSPRQSKSDWFFIVKREIDLFFLSQTIAVVAELETHSTTNALVKETHNNEHAKVFFTSKQIRWSLLGEHHFVSLVAHLRWL